MLDRAIQFMLRVVFALALALCAQNSTSAQTGGNGTWDPPGFYCGASVPAAPAAVPQCEDPEIPDWPCVTQCRKDFKTVATALYNAACTEESAIIAAASACELSLDPANFATIEEYLAAVEACYDQMDTDLAALDATMQTAMDAAIASCIACIEGCCKPGISRAGSALAPPDLFLAGLTDRQLAPAVDRGWLLLGG